MRAGHTSWLGERRTKACRRTWTRRTRRCRWAAQAYPHEHGCVLLRVRQRASLGGAAGSKGQLRPPAPASLPHSGLTTDPLPSEPLGLQASWLHARTPGNPASRCRPQPRARAPTREDEPQPT
eukprot:365396-Chlamydomonas_euryale.AAC.20